MKAIILAAGYATRLYPLTLNVPKALLPIDNKAIIDYIADEIDTLDNVDEIIVTSNHKFYEPFREWAKTRNGRLPVTILDDGTVSENDRLGAVGDILFTVNAANLDDDLLIIAGDNFFTYKLSDCRDFYLSHGDCACGREIDDIERLRSFAVASIDENNRITALVEKPSQPASKLAVYATYFYSKETAKLFCKYLDDGNKGDSPGCFLEWLSKEKPVYLYCFDGECIDIGTPETYKDVCENFASIMKR